MCGITGIVRAGNLQDGRLIKAMTDVLRHRGPDDEGYLLFDTKSRECEERGGKDTPAELGLRPIEGGSSKTFDSVFGFRRLSILDLSPAGHQPMNYDGGDLWIVFNGEIYNYVELREELKSKGYAFRTSTDTEVLLASYREWGEACLEKFNGMWAFVIYDQRRDILFGSRDRFGVKPLYYTIGNSGFAFASEIKALLELPFMKRQFNPPAVFDYLVFDWEEREEEGFFKDIFELRPSYAFRYDLKAGTVKKWKYYDLKYTERWENFSESKMEERALKVRELIFNAVTLRLRSDVPIGTCLSGGIDSSTIVTAISRLMEKEGVKQIGSMQKVFTASYDNDAVDESVWAKMVVEGTRTSWYRTYPAARELLKDLGDLVYSQDVPFGSTSIYAQYRVMKLAKENGVKVLLDGQGGDELFTGYPGYYPTFFAEMIRLGKLGRLAQEFNSLDNSPVGRAYLLSTLAKTFGARLLPASLKGVILRAMHKEHKYIDADFWNEHSLRLDMAEDLATASLNKMLHKLLAEINLKTLLRYEDRNSMRFSIEARTPYADDRDLIEYVFRVPSSYKIHMGWSKSLLREATKGLLPEAVSLRRDKKGFNTPEYLWLNAIKDDLRDCLTENLTGILDIGEMKRDWDRLVKSQAQEGATYLWRFVSLALWKETFRCGY